MTSGRPSPPPPRRTLAAFALLAGCNDFVLSRRSDEVIDPVRITETFTQAPQPRVDLLWVVDDTPSMAAEHVALVSALPVFAAALADAGLAWQLGVVTTDLGADPGRLRGDPWILTPRDADLLPDLLAIADVSADGDEPAGGRGAAAAALQEPLRSGDNRGFRRPDAALHVIFVSDGDDGSGALLGADAAAAFLDLMDAEAAATGRPARASAVVGDRGAGCSGPGGTALPGDTYLDVVEATGGATASICQADLTPVAAALGDQSIDWQDTFVLQARPEPGTVRVTVDGAATPDWSLATAPPAITFDAPPPPGATIVVRYALLDDA